MHLGCEDDTAAMQLKVAQIGPLLPPPQRRHSVTQGCLIYILDIAQILVQSHFELISSVLALEATEPLAEPVAEPVAELAVELINNHLISVHQKR